MPADMHTHSEHSHDSSCRIEEMLRAQLEKGTAIFAVTDHFDTASCGDYDIFTPILKAHETVASLNRQYSGKVLLLSGVEISEGFWHPAAYEKIRTMTDYDVIIGSVHLVRFPELSYAYSKIDFSVLSDETIAAYLDAYFDDVLTMLDTIDFDILAHLTCPLRYISGKYHRSISLDAYKEKIDRILRRIIEKGIALEVNTSYAESPGSFMPSAEILKRYRALGGTLLTLGSDAHVPQNASNHFDEALYLLGSAGFDKIYYYQKRTPHPISISALCCSRVARMETLFDLLSRALRTDPASLQKDPVLCEAAKTLTDYMDSGLWLLDYERDERGEFPQTLKRGILSQDALYDLICAIEAYQRQ